MRHQTQLAHRRGLLQAANQFVCPVGREAQAIHAGVELEPYGARKPADLLQHLDLLDVVYDQFEAAGERNAEFLDGRHTGQQHDGLVDARFAQQQRLGQSRNRQRVRPVEVPGNGHQAVAVGIRLDHGHDARIRHNALHDIQVVF